MSKSSAGLVNVRCWPQNFRFARSVGRVGIEFTFPLPSAVVDVTDLGNHALRTISVTEWKVVKSKVGKVREPLQDFVHSFVHQTHLRSPCLIGFVTLTRNLGKQILFLGSGFSWARMLAARIGKIIRRNSCQLEELNRSFPLM